MLEFAVRAQVVAAGVGGAAKRALKASRKMHMVVISNMRNHFTAQFAAMQVTAARQSLERQTHMPRFGTCHWWPTLVDTYKSGVTNGETIYSQFLSIFMQFEIINLFN